MTLFEIFVIIILLATLSHTAVGVVIFGLSGSFTIFTPYELWIEFRCLSSVLLVYIPYTIFAPIFAIVGLVVWVMGY